MIKFKKVSKIYPARGSLNNKIIKALADISFRVNSKEFVSIMGRSGAGKTTLLKLILGEEKPSSGEIFFEDQNIAEIKSCDLPYLRRKIGAIFQDYKLFPTKTIYENVAYVLEVMGATDKEIEYNVPEVLDIVELNERAENFPAELSGGERQRAAIARALIHRPEVILADEPTGNLDPYHTQDILRLLCKIQEMGTTVILATHNKEIINSLQRRVITLEDGRVIRDEAKGRFIL